jgi:hydrophobic/amphiphilic exporter-1 (mainly G- bacteria), HAE1 family
MFSHFFIKRPIFAGVISIVIVLLGLLSLFSLPIARYPEIAPPTITVTALYPGADAQSVADTVATPIEAEVNGVENMLYMNSVCGNDGSYSLTVTFAAGTDLDTANVLTQNRVSSAIASLPQEAQRMGVTVKKKSTDANIYLSLFSPDGSLDGLFLSNYANMQLRDELARSPGVGQVDSFGVGDYSMRIWLDPEAMRVRQVSVDEVINAVRDQNVQVAAGKVGEPPVPEGQANTLSIRVSGRLPDTESFGKIIIRANEDGQILRLEDISRIELGSSAYNITSAYQGKDSATLVVYQIPGANALQVVAGVRARLAELEKSFPDGLDYRIVYDNTDVIKASIKQVVMNLFATLALVVFTVYLFLQNFRATIIPSVTIPVSLVGTFGAMAAMGYSINQFTLFGLVLVIGIVVDDAIVVVENCTRLLDEGKSPKDAAMETMTEVSGPVIATTLVLLAVFIPTTMLSGIVGTLFKQFAVTISIATVFSSINALTLSPALCGVLLKPSTGPTRNPFFKMFNRTVDNSRSLCTGIVRTAIRRVAFGALLFAGMVALAVIGFGQLSSGFVPQEDEGYCLVNLSLPDAASQERMVAFSKEAEKVVADIPGVKDYITITGYSILDNVAIPNAGFMLVVFEPWAERSKEEHQRFILQQLNRGFSRIQNGVAQAFPVPSLPGVGLTAGISFMLQDRGGVGMEVLQNTGDSFIADGNAQTGLSSMYTLFRAAVPQLKVNVDRDQVLTKGLPLSSVFAAMQTFLGSSYVNDITLFNRSFQVKAQADRRFRAQPDDILNLEVLHPNGSSVPLSALASVEEIVGPQSITRFNQYPSMKVLGQPSPGFSTGDAMEIVEDMAAQKLSSAVGYEWVDLSYQEKMASGSTSSVFVLSIILVFLVLAAQYESWSLPVSVCLAVPTALLGAVAGIMARGYDNNVYTQVGIVLLIGLATKTAILLVEFANIQHKAGKSLTEAAAGAVDLRLRAVLMTAFSFILGVLPLLFATGAGSESQKVIGTTVFAGMLLSTVLSLIAIPMLYFLVARLTGEKDEAPRPEEVAS